MEGKKAVKSKLTATGIILIILSFLSKPTAHLAQSISEDTIKALVLISTDVLRACFFIGIGCVIIGAIRNRKNKMNKGAV